MKTQYLITWKTNPSWRVMCFVREGSSIAEVTEQALAEIREAYPAGVLVDVIEYSEWYARAQA